MARQLLLALRRIRSRPAESALAVAALVLGLGSVASVVAVVDAVLLRPLPIEAPEQVVALVRTRVVEGGFYVNTFHSTATWRQAESLDALANWRPVDLARVDADGVARRLRAHEVEPGYFELLGLSTTAGRFFDDAESEADPIVVSHRFWRTEMGSDPDAVGRTLRLGGSGEGTGGSTGQSTGDRIIVGVMEPLPDLPALAFADAWVPLEVDEAAAMAEPLGGFRTLARVRTGTDPDAAAAELDALSAALATARPETDDGWGVSVQPIGPWIVGGARQPLLALLGVALLVLLVALATVSSLGVARAFDRRREASIRRALGARGSGLVGSWLAEWSVLGFVGGAGGLGVAWLAASAARSLDFDLPRLASVQIDGALAAATVLGGVLAGLVAGLLAARSAVASDVSGSHPSLASRSFGAFGDLGALRLRMLLVAGQTALAVVALLVAFLLGRSLQKLVEVDPGFDANSLLTFRLELPASDDTSEALRARWTGVLERLEAVPGVERAATASSAPLTGYAGVFEVWVDGDEGRRGPRPDVRTDAQIVSPGYFDVLGLELLAGRVFGADETWDGRQAVVANHAFVREHLGTDDPSAALGRHVTWQSGDRGEIVGVVADLRATSIDREPPPTLHIAWGIVSPGRLVGLRTAPPSATDPATDPASLLPAVRRALAEELPGTPIHTARTGADLLADGLERRRFLAWLSSVFAGVAQVLALLGLYGVVAGLVARSRHDIAVRLALGARAADIRRWTLRRGLLPVLAGLAFGAGAALAAIRWLDTAVLRSQLYGIDTVDPVSFLLAPAAVLLAAVLVVELPALRAARVDPASALRAES